MSLVLVPMELTVSLMYMLHGEQASGMATVRAHRKLRCAFKPFFRQPKRFRMMNDWSDDEFRALFRFEKRHMAEIMQELRIPPTFATLRYRYRVPGETAFLMFLLRMAHAETYVALLERFGGYPVWLSDVWHTVNMHINNNFRHVLTDLHRWDNLVPQFAAYIHEKSGYYENIFGFIDGKLFKTCRPIQDQREIYNGHKKHHGIKDQSVSFPNGMIGHFFGPVSGRRHDSTMLRISGLKQQLYAMNTRLGININDDLLWAIYGDPAYERSKVILPPWKHGMAPARQAMNTAMSQSRITVEWGFGNFESNSVLALC